MFQRLNEMRERREAGFTLIELMVVVLIIAILIAIAIPTFLGLRERAQNRAAQSDLRNALTAAKAFYTDDETFVGFDAAGVADSIEPSLNYDLTGGAAAQGVVSIVVVGQDELVVKTQSESGQNFCIGEVTTGAAAGTSLGDDDAATAAGCAGGF